jgi:hypothetical protein
MVDAATPSTEQNVTRKLQKLVGPSPLLYRYISNLNCLANQDLS